MDFSQNDPDKISEPQVWVNFLCYSPHIFKRMVPLLPPFVRVLRVHKNTWQLYMLTETDINLAITDVYVMYDIMY